MSCPLCPQSPQEDLDTDRQMSANVRSVRSIQTAEILHSFSHRRYGCRAFASFGLISTGYSAWRSREGGYIIRQTVLIRRAFSIQANHTHTNTHIARSPARLYASKIPSPNLVRAAAEIA
jgi:hypothetical protein